jgi:cyanophycinase
VAGGGSGELKKGVVQMSHGLGWLGDDIIVDTHFGARGRFPRLASAVAEHPAALGVGIDENTCLLVDADGGCTVAGTGVVYLIDADRAHLNTAPAVSTGHPISAGPLNVSVLAAGQTYDLRTRSLKAVQSTRQPAKRKTQENRKQNSRLCTPPTHQV